jgi:hypothetical protein
MLYKPIPLTIFVGLVGWLIALNVTFNNISVILWWSVLLVDETGLRQSAAKHFQVAVSFICR